MTTGKSLRAFTLSSIAAVWTLAGASGAASADAVSINVVERAKTDNVLDLGDKDDSAGDILTFANELFDEGNATKIGDDTGWCIRIVPGKAWECVLTATLADGQISAQGPFLDGKDSVWSVIGGTGKYAAARGEMQLHSRNPEGSEFDFRFRLTN
jgi:hypothetical protein